MCKGVGTPVRVGALRPSHTRVRLSHDFKIGSDFACFTIGTGRSDFENRQVCSHTIAIHRSRFFYC